MRPPSESEREAAKRKFVERDAFKWLLLEHGELAHCTPVG
jgi:hypothetical protein